MTLGSLEDYYWGDWDYNPDYEIFYEYDAILKSYEEVKSKRRKKRSPKEEELPDFSGDSVLCLL